MKRKRSVNRGEEPASGVCATMIDVIFLLLIFFILLPFKIPDNRIDLPLPKEGGPGPGPIDDPTEVVLTLRIRAQGEDALYLLDERRVDPFLIGMELKKATAGLPGARVQIRPEGEVAFGHVIRALDQCAGADVKNVSVGL